MSYADSIMLLSIGWPHSMRIIASTMATMKERCEKEICWREGMPVSRSTCAIYARVSFSVAGAQREIIFSMVLKRCVNPLYPEMYRRRMINPALTPYCIDSNCSKDLSSCGYFSPCQLLPFLMFSGLLFRMPRGSIFLSISAGNYKVVDS